MAEEKATKINRILLRRELDGWSVSDEFHISFDGLLNELKKIGFEIVKEPQGKYHKVFLVAPKEENFLDKVKKFVRRK